MDGVLKWLKKINESRLLFIGTFILFGLIILALNYWTTYTTDDYNYMFSWVDTTTRIENVWQIFGSLKAHSISHGGRYVAHFFAQLFLMLHPYIFDIANSIVYLLLIWVIYRICFQDSLNVLFLWAIAAALWYFTPAYGQVYLWLDGSCNYLWAVTFSMLYLYPLLNYWNGNMELGGLRSIFYVLAGLAIGNYLETVSFAVILVFIVTVAVSIIKNRNCPLWIAGSTLCLIIGYMFMLLAPGTSTNKIDLTAIFDNFDNAKEMYNENLGILALVFLALFAISLASRNDKRTNLTALGCFVLSLVTNYMHMVASYYPERSMLASTIFLILGVGVLLASFVKLQMGSLMFYNCILLLVLTVSPFWAGYKDIRYTQWQCDVREEMIVEAVEAGDTDIELPLITSSTKYSAKYGLKDLDTEDSTSWPNKCMAQYYGVNSIIGIAEED